MLEPQLGNLVTPVAMTDVLDKPDTTELDPALKDLVEHTDDPGKDYLHCAACSAVISNLANAIEINGSHHHHCTNPHGFDFHVGCFNEALGCSISGEREHADSWFPGFLWRYASCSECQQHLGWYFDHSEAYFYGLIMDRVQS